MVVEQDQIVAVQSVATRTIVDYRFRVLLLQKDNSTRDSLITLPKKMTKRVIFSYFTCSIKSIYSCKAFP